MNRIGEMVIDQMTLIIAFELGNLGIYSRMPRGNCRACTIPLTYRGDALPREK
jgi:hypothetical protein